MTLNFLSKPCATSHHMLYSQSENDLPYASFVNLLKEDPSYSLQIYLNLIHKVPALAIFSISSANSRQYKTLFLSWAISSELRSLRISARNNSKSLANSPLCPGVGGGGDLTGAGVRTVPSSNLNSLKVCLGFPSRTLSIMHVNGLRTTKLCVSGLGLMWLTHIASAYPSFCVMK